MMKRDAYYTPFPVSLRMVIHAQCTPRRILDPSVGDGSLLAAAIQRWPRATAIANDVSAAALRETRHRLEELESSQVDFLRAGSDQGKLARLRSRWAPDLILLNPPFSGRTRHRHIVAVGEDIQAKVSQAAAFLLASAQLLAAKGVIVAVMPASFMTSSRDNTARSLISMMGSLRIVESLPRKAFAGCRAATVLVRFERSANEAVRLRSPTTESRSPDLLALVTSFVRGNTRVHETRKYGRRGSLFLHTRHIRAGSATPVVRQVPRGARSVRGPVVLIPRVGCNPGSKVVVAFFGRPVVISDCLYALRTRTQVDALRLKKSIDSAWGTIGAEYVGTGAPHIRAGALLDALGQLADVSKPLGRTTATI
jgi:hypothetical protein